MRASDLIRELQCEIGVHGDLEVEIYDGLRETDADCGYHRIGGLQRVVGEFVLFREGE